MVSIKLVNNKKALIATIVVIAIWLFVINSGKANCAVCTPDSICPTWFNYPKIMPTCECCYGFEDFLGQLMLFVFIPFLLLYFFFYSLLTMLCREK